MDSTQNGKDHHNNNNNNNNNNTHLYNLKRTQQMGRPNEINHTSQTTFSADNPSKTLAMASSYLRTFMVEDCGSSEDDAASPRKHSAASPRKPHNSFFYRSHDELAADDDIFPKHPAKRKRTSSNSSSNSEGEARAPVRRYSRTNSARTSRNNSEKSAKSGPICGTFGSKSDRPCYRPKFPSNDDSDEFKDSVKSAKSRSPATQSPGGIYATHRPRFPSNRPRFPSNSSDKVTRVTSPRPSSPKPEIKQDSDKETLSDDQTDEQTDEQTDKETDKETREASTERQPRTRPERSAATKAQGLIKKIGPRHRLTREFKLCESEEDFYSDGSNYDVGVPKYALDKYLLKSLPSPLQIGYNLYSQVRNDPSLKQDLAPFLEPVDSSHEVTKEYYKKIEKPMCLTKIEEKMTNLNYFSTPEIIGDLRLMLENCYRFNGVHSWISKHACKIEMSLEQRITLLPYSMRGKCSIAETSPHLTLYRDVCGRRTRTPRMFTGCSRSPIMIAMEDMMLYREKEAEIMQVQKSYRQEARLQENIVTIASFVSNNCDFKRIASSWELISSSLMICVCQEAFNIPFTVGALELGLLYPKHSKYLARLMVRLSSTGKRNKELEKQDNISYLEWNREIAGRVRYWYVTTKRHGTREAQTTTGVTREMYGVFGSYKSPLGGLPTTPVPCEGRLFHELSVTERLTLLHSLCTSKVTMSPRLQNCFEVYEAESLRPTTLGQDGHGNCYFHFPLWPEEVRVYVELPPGRDETLGEVRCVARSTDDLLPVIEQLKTSGQLSSLVEGRKRAGHNKRQLLSAAKPLVKKLDELYQELLPHKDHHILVDTAVYKELAEAMVHEVSLEPQAPPQTPPRPATPPPQPTDLSQDQASHSDVERGDSEREESGESGGETEQGIKTETDTEQEVRTETAAENEPDLTAGGIEEDLLEKGDESDDVKTVAGPPSPVTKSNTSERNVELNLNS